MEGNTTYTDEQFSEYTYGNIEETKQFASTCEKWKAKPSAARRTETQFRNFFKEKYTLHTKKKNSLEDAGITNSAKNEEYEAMKQELAELCEQVHKQEGTTNAFQAVMETVKQSDNHTAMTSEITASTAQQAEIAALKAQVAMLQATQNTVPPTPTGVPSTIKLAHFDGLPKLQSDVGNGTKKKKYYKTNDNACWTCGYDIAKGHNSTNCRYKRPGHVDWHTGDNPAPGHNPKDIEFSKWKDNTTNKAKAAQQ